MIFSSPARHQLIERIESVSEAVSMPFLIDGPFSEKVHNSRARLLRNGLMVVAFTSLEDFLRNRTKELLGHVSRTVVQFSALPDRLRAAATESAMQAAISRASIEKRAGADPIGLLQDTAACIASTAGGALQISQFSLGYSGPNVTSDEIKNMLGAFQLSNPWAQISSFASRCGFGSLPLEQGYKGMQINRNKAAHNTNANIQPGDLETFCNQALAIACGFDILASRAARLINKGDAGILSEKLDLDSKVDIRFIDHTTRGYAEISERKSRAVKVSSSVDESWNLAIDHAAKRREAIIERNRRAMPINWHSSDVT